MKRSHQLALLLALAPLHGACEPQEIRLLSAPPARDDVRDAAPNPMTPSARPEAGTSPSDASVPRLQPACASSACQMCVESGSCTGAAACHPFTGLCVLACDYLMNSECPLTSTPYCDGRYGASSVCVACFLDQHCAAGRRCQTDRGECVECTEDSHCTGLGLTKCNTDSWTCVGCLEDSDCPTSAPFCSQGTQACQECRVDTDCPADRPVCETPEFECDDEDEDDGDEDDDDDEEIDEDDDN